MPENDREHEDQGAGEQADQMEERAERMEKGTDELEGDIEGVRRDWDSKKHEESVPGAQTEEGATGRSGEGNGEGTED